MKKFIFLIAILISVSLSAQIGWEAAGKPIRNGVNIEWFRAGTPTNDNDVVYVWSDTRNGDRDVWAQKVSANGDLLWGEGGKLINGEVNRQEDIVVINSQNSIITAWVDYRNEDAGDIYAQKLDYDGNIQWTSAGLPLCTVPDTQISLNIVSDEQGGAYIIWIDHRNGNNDIYGVHLNSDGTLANGWEQNGNPIVQEPGSQTGHTFWEDGQGGAILVWTDQQDQNDNNLYAQRIAPDGTLLWGQHGIAITTAPGNQTNPKIAPDGTGNFIVTWMDKRIPTNNGDIYAQRINLNGEKLWTNDLLIYGDNDFQENPRIRQADDNGVFIVWQDGRNENNTEDIYVQKVSPEGNLLWNPEGIPVVMQPYNQKNPRIVTDNQNGCWIIWDDSRNNDFPNVDIYIQHFDANGNALLQENGEVVCNAEGLQFSPLVKKSTDGHIFATWGDNRGGYTGIYFQTYNQQGEPLLQDNGVLIYTGLSGNARNYIVKRNHSGNPAIFWSDNRSSEGIALYFQEIDHYGNYGLPENGFRITTPFNIADETKLYDVVSNPAKDEFAIAFKKQLFDSHKIYLQILDSSGNMQFPEEGFPVIADPENNLGDAKYPAVSILDAQNSTYLVAWTDNAIVGDDFSTFKIFAQKIQNGQRLWGQEGKFICSDPDILRDYNVKTVIQDYIIWQSEEPYNYDLYIIRLDDNGNPYNGWSESGIAISAAEGIQQNPKAIMTPQGIICIWEDVRNGNSDIYGQLITPDGETMWENDGKPLIVADRDQFPSNLVLRDDNFVISYENYLDNGLTNIKQAVFDFNGNSVLQDSLTVVSGDFSATSPSQTITESNDIYVFWSDYRVEGQSDLYAQKIDENSQPVWANNGIPICQALKNQNSPVAFTDDDNYVFTFWEDTRSSGKTDIYAIYAQLLTDDAGAFDNQIPNDNLNIGVRNYPNPFASSTKFVINSQTKIPIEGYIKIFNLKGQLVKKLKIKDNTAVLNKKKEKLNSGIYFYRVDTSDGHSKVHKMILIK